MMIRFRHDDDRHRVVDAIFFDGEHDIERGQVPGVRYSYQRTNLDDLDDTDREAVAVLILKRWYKNVVATNESLRTYGRDDEERAYKNTVEETANDVVEYAKDILKADGYVNDYDHVRIYERLNEAVETGLNQVDNLDVLRFTDNENAIDMHGMPLDEENPVQDIAYWAFYQDVVDAMSEQIDINKRDLGLDLEEETKENDNDDK